MTSTVWHSFSKQRLLDQFHRGKKGEVEERKKRNVHGQADESKFYYNAVAG